MRQTKQPYYGALSPVTIETVNMNTKEKRGSGRLMGIFRQFLATACLGPITVGANISWTSPVLPQLQDTDTDFEAEFTVSEESWVGSMLAIGVLITSIPGGYLADRFGIKKCVFASAGLTIAFAVIVIFTSNFYWLCAARFLSGAAVGLVYIIGPMYICEISDVALRGTVGSFFEFGIYVGVFFVTVCGTYVDYLQLTFIVAVFTFVFGVMFLAMPEAPTYLIRTNRHTDAENVLKFYRGSNIDVEEALKEIRDGIKEKTRKRPSIKRILMSKCVARGLVACVGLAIFQQLSGVDAFLLYAVQIFQATGTNMDAYSSAIIIAAVQMFAAVVAVFIVEKARRRLLLYISTVGAGLSLVIMGAYFHMQHFEITFIGFDLIPLISFTIFSLSYAIGLGPVLWMINGELFSHEIKGVANGIITTANWIFLFIVSKSFPIMMDKFAPEYTFYFFAVCMVACIALIKFFVPETRGKTLEEIQNELNS